MEKDIDSRFTLMTMMMLLRRVQYTTQWEEAGQAGPRKEKSCVTKLLFPVVRIDRPGTKLYLYLAWPRRAAVQQLLKPTVRYDTMRCDVSRSMRHLDELASFKIIYTAEEVEFDSFSSSAQYKTTLSLDLAHELPPKRNKHLQGRFTWR